MDKYIEQVIEIVVAYAPKLVGAVIALLIGLWVIGRLTEVIKNLMEKANVDESLRKFLGSLVNVGLKLMLFLAIAAQFGIETSSFVAVLAAASFAIGMALQGSLANFAGGVLLLLFKPFKVGDLIEAQGFTGVVDEIQIFNTLLLTPDNKKIIIPNGPLSNGPITNISGQGIIRVDLVFGIAYSDNIDKARKVIGEVIQSCPTALKDKEHDIFVNELADSSVNFATRVWTKSEHYWDTYFFMHENIKKSFDAKGLNFPYPTMDVNVAQQ